ncbi:MAG TPA: DUF6498-containing protein [Burkholderiales bacterium]|nr:DUF6498-containing protein [Burkholderiales bacterium]
MSARFLQRVASAESPGLLLKSWLFCLVYCALAFSIFYVFAFRAREIFPALIGGFFAVFGVVYVWATFQKTLEYLRFGEVALRLESAPVLGGELVARLLWPAEGVRELRAELSASEMATETNAKGREVRRERVRWREERTFAAGGGGPLLRMRIPDAPEVERGAPYTWKLRVQAELPGVDFDRSYPIEVGQPAPGSPPPAPLLPEELAQAAAPAPGPQAPPRPVAVPLLLLANAVPLVGVLAWDWRVGDVVILYWIENLVIGLYNVLRILAAQPEGARAGLMAGKIFLAAFFLVHYGGFCAGHGVFLAALFPVAGPGGAKLGIDGVVLDMLREPGLLVAVAALTLSHGYSFVRNYLGRGEYRRADVQRLMMQPYGRILVVHLFVIFGGMLVQGVKAQVPALLLFIALKTFIDYRMHRRERRLLATPPAAR